MDSELGRVIANLHTSLSPVAKVGHGPTAEFQAF
jgi:hypothetical protein